MFDANLEPPKYTLKNPRISVPLSCGCRHFPEKGSSCREAVNLHRLTSTPQPFSRLAAYGQSEELQTVGSSVYCYVGTCSAPSRRRPTIDCYVVSPIMRVERAMLRTNGYAEI